MLTAIPKPAPPAARELAKVDTVTELIGNTPLVEIRSVARGLSPGVRVLAKLEGFNPGGSVKDRAALRMIREAVRTGQLRPGQTIIESTSGNTGIAIAMIGAALGYPVRLVLPSNVSEERKGIIRFFGGDIVYSNPMEGSDGAIRLCREIVGEEPGIYFKPDQYFNPMNSQAHYETTGPEIHRQTGGSVTHFVAGIGTGGTVMGTGRFLKERDPRIRVIAAEPDAALHGLEGLKHMASSIVPGIYHEEDLDLKIPVSTEDAYEMVYRLSQEEGLLVGQSSGAALDAALQIARQLTHGTVVTVFPDFGSRYMTTNLWTTWKEKLDVGNLDFSI
ncbi:Cysteine synthase [Geodia barretti]|uniref:Cysteine synthase n=1 Tax=Geodia barretti TaxID=519541 RepID=A0AA35R244_GEOBA|nr:Cysteine synthase [Geodia barretti]